MDNFKKALKYSFLLLKYRDRATCEIIDRLKKKKYTQAVIDKVIKYLSGYNYINDGEFVVNFAEYKVFKGFGEKRIIFDLEKLGLSVEFIKEQLAKFNKNKYKSAIVELAHKKIKDYKETDNKRSKLFRYLTQRGFSYQEMTKAFKKVKI